MRPTPLGDLICPFCKNPLTEAHPDGWSCSCGEFVPHGFEIDAMENCETCPAKNCSRRK